MKKSLGQSGEDVACNYLLSRGYTLICRNYFNSKGYRIGEIDLIMKNEKEEYIFVEVKALKGRKGECFPECNIGKAKLHRLNRIIQRFLNERDLLGFSWRLDAVSVVFDFSLRKLEIRHIKNIRI